ncbi:hypothetical protein [uncultured Bacteroides sp.]|jgi:hypothetical protein|uniref:hypothetical protein n=1 Tax=uncultured Bacteroides sp. TaxID=162156 RepID=UPI0025865969|nr:hypothetical protein [uncultured Bacteroides sp.]
MKQKLLTDIELDVHELKYLMESFSKEPTQTLSELLKRSIARMQGRLDELSQEVDAVEVESVVVEEDEAGDSLIAEEKPVITEEVPVVEEEPVIDKKEELKSAVLGESIKLAAGLRHSISLNDSFRFSRELFKGDTDLMNRVVEQISVMSSYKTAVAFLSSKIEIDEEKEAVVDFLELLKKYFNQSV